MSLPLLILAMIFLAACDGADDRGAERPDVTDLVNLAEYQGGVVRVAVADQQPEETSRSCAGLIPAMMAVPGASSANSIECRVDGVDWSAFGFDVEDGVYRLQSVPMVVLYTRGSPDPSTSPWCTQAARQIVSGSVDPPASAVVGACQAWTRELVDGEEMEIWTQVPSAVAEPGARCVDLFLADPHYGMDEPLTVQRCSVRLLPVLEGGG